MESLEQLAKLQTEVDELKKTLASHRVKFDCVNERLDKLEKWVDRVERQADSETMGTEVAERGEGIKTDGEEAETHMETNQRPNHLDIVGDCVAEASQYYHVEDITSPPVTDPEIFVNLYGLTPAQVLRLKSDNNLAAIKVLDMYASAEAQEGIAVTRDVRTAFWDFVRELDASGFGDVEAADEVSGLGVAYIDFLVAHVLYLAAVARYE